MALVFVALLVGLGCTTTAEPDIQGTVEAAVADYYPGGHA